MDSNNMQRPKSTKKAGFFKSIKIKVKRYIREKEEERYSKDIIFTEPITPVPEVKEAPQILCRGGIDMQLLLYTVLLLCFGALMSFSASAVYAENEYDQSTYFLVRYILYAFMSIIITVPFVMYARPWFWRVFGMLSYIGSIVLLLLVLVIGDESSGAQRWINIGGIITIQPSEIAKMAVVMMLALFMSKYEKEITSTHKWGGNFKYGVLMPMAIIGLICGLIALEKHISGLMIVAMIGFSVMYIGGTRQKWLALLVGGIVFAGVFLILVSDYAQVRVNTWLFIDKVDPLGPAWQTLQGLYAIGSGGFFGIGLGNSRQKYGYVSEPQNDFIFTIICEELGFIGALALLVLFTLLIIRGFKIASRAPDKFSSLVVYGLVFKIALQVAMNMAVVTNMMPNTGISLPFFSSGGTSLALQIFEIGIILSISRFSTHKK